MSVCSGSPLQSFQTVIQYFSPPSPYVSQESLLGLKPATTVPRVMVEP